MATNTPTVAATSTVTPTPPPAGTPTATSNGGTFLDENYFNPLQKALGMDVRVDTGGMVKVMILNIAGEKVAEALHQYEPAGQYRVYWDGKNNQGALVGNGVYFVVIQQFSGTLTRKVIVLK